MLPRCLGHLLFLAQLLAALTACQSGFYAPCQKAIDCRGGSDADVDACIEQYRGQESIAEAYDCDDAFDKLFSCERDKSSCSDARTYSDNHACDRERAALESCKRVASAVQ